MNPRSLLGLLMLFLSSSCSLTPPVTELTPGLPFDGRLEKGEDVDWFTLPAGIYTVYVDTTACGCADIELLVDQVGKPQRAVVKRSGSDINIFHVLPALDPAHPPRLGVRSVSGTGCYRILASNLRQAISPRVEFSNARWSATDRRSAAEIYVLATRDLLSATDGMVLVTGTDFYSECPLCDSDVFMSAAWGRSHALLGLSIKLYAGWKDDQVAFQYTAQSSADVLVHELGHHVWWLPDEYKDRTRPDGRVVSDPKCPPSLMATSGLHTFCFSGNHAAKPDVKLSAWEDIVQDWAQDKAKGTTQPAALIYRGIENKLRDSLAWNNCPECSTVIFPAIARNLLDADTDGVPDCQEVDTDRDGVDDHQDCDPGDPEIYAGVDFDGDGDQRAGCGGADCDDGDASRSSLVGEECNGRDDDCDGKIDDGFPDFDGDGRADCVDPNDDGDCVTDLFDNCTTAPNCSSAQAVLDSATRRGLACTDPCIRRLDIQSLQDVTKCLFGRTQVGRNCMVDGCSPFDFGLTISPDVMRGAGLRVEFDQKGAARGFTTPGFQVPSAQVCDSLIKNQAGINAAADILELRCRQKERAKPEYAACQADRDVDGLGDACD